MAGCCRAYVAGDAPRRQRYGILRAAPACLLWCCRSRGTDISGRANLARPGRENRCAGFRPGARRRCDQGGGPVRQIAGHAVQRRAALARRCRGKTARRRRSGRLNLRWRATRGLARLDAVVHLPAWLHDRPPRQLTAASRRQRPLGLAAPRARGCSIACVRGSASRDANACSKCDGASNRGTPCPCRDEDEMCAGRRSRCGNWVQGPSASAKLQQCGRCLAFELHKSLPRKTVCGSASRAYSILRRSKRCAVASVELWNVSACRVEARRRSGTGTSTGPPAASGANLPAPIPRTETASTSPWIQETTRVRSARSRSHALVSTISASLERSSLLSSTMSALRICWRDDIADILVGSKGLSPPTHPRA